MSYEEMSGRPVQKHGVGYKIFWAVVIALSVGLLIYVDSLKREDPNFGWSP